jgi:hypothetical protein
MGVWRLGRRLLVLGEALVSLGRVGDVERG